MVNCSTGHLFLSPKVVGVWVLAITNFKDAVVLITCVN